MPDTLRSTVEHIVGAELATARHRFGPMHSAHEGYAVIREEVEEHAEEGNAIARALAELWTAVRRNDLDAALAHAEDVERWATAAATEAVQVAAMARRFRTDLAGARDA